MAGGGDIMGGGAAPVLCVENKNENDYQLFVVRDLIHPSTFGPKQARSSPSVNSKKKTHGLTSWLGPSQTSFQPAAVQTNRLGSGSVLRGPSSTRAEPRNARAEPKTRPVRPALRGGRGGGRGEVEAAGTHGVGRWGLLPVVSWEARACR